MKKRTFSILIYFMPVPVIIISLFIGPSDIANFAAVRDWITGFFYENTSGSNEMVSNILLNVRLPRIIMSFMVGAALAMSGSGLQAIFRNPLVSPYILGLSSGAAFGAALALATAFLPIQLSAFVFGISAALMSYFLAWRKGEVPVVSLILAGIVVTGIFTALLTIVQFISDPFRLQGIVHWTMGNLHNAGWSKLKGFVLPALTGMIVLFVMRWRLNILALGDEEARTSGINPVRDKWIILIAATMASSAAVAVAGIIGLYGLMVPHMVRMMQGPDNRRTMPANFLFGGTFLLIIDDLSRSLTDFEIPVGVFTMLLGAPFFIFLMKKTKTGWE